MRRFSQQIGNSPIRRCRIAACVLGLIACGGFAASAATAAFDDAGIGAPIKRPLAEPTTLAPNPYDPKVAAPRANPLWSIPLSSLSYTRERPLFSPSRRPPAAAVTAGPPSAAPPPPRPAEPDRPPLTLVGTIVGTTQSIGVFIDQATKAVVRLRPGEAHASWTLRAIAGREVILQKDREETTLALPAPGATRQLATTAPGPAPSQPASIAVLPAAAPADGATPPPNGSPPSTRAEDKAAAAGAAIWVDGDGQVISPPPSAKWAQEQKQDVAPPTPGQSQTGSPAAAAPTVWVDGDGQSIGPPPSFRPAERENREGPPATAWVDGDGQTIGAPPSRAKSNGPYAWVDGDGQIISPR